MSNSEKKKVPVIVSDIDGVLKQGFDKYISDRVLKALKAVRSLLGEIDEQRFGANDQEKIPFFLLTNRGAMTEKQHCIMMNKAMGFDKEQYSKYAFQDHENILNHSALVPKFKTFQDKLVMLLGTGEIEEVAEYCGSQKYITGIEYICCFPFLCPFNSISEEFQAETKEKVKKRLNLTDDDFREPFQCHAIFILSMPFNWEESTQLILDLLSTEDGKIAQQMPAIGPEKHIPIYVAYNDTTYKSEFQLPRIVNGCFTAAIKEIYKTIYKREINLEFYGKPQLKQFEFARDYTLSHIDKNHEVTNYYMIGDNPQSDIQGANKIGWTSILVRTGVFQGEGNDDQDPAKYVVNDFYDAIKLIFEQEGISTKILD
ncbi:hypothetical protein ABPG72_013769 [Tetrahymena utriculariae]